MRRRLITVPITLREAHRFVADHHRRRKRDRGGKFAIGCSQADDPRICGVIVVGRPKPRMRQDGWTAEITRCATDGTKNACSFLYGAACRAAFAMGYLRVGTYTLKTEPGSSLRAAGFKIIGEVKGASWGRNTRPRIDTDDQRQDKFLWERASA